MKHPKPQHMQVMPYSFSNLCYVIATHIKRPVREVCNKSQLLHICKGLGQLSEQPGRATNPMTMVVELEYLVLCSPERLCHF